MKKFWAGLMAGLCLLAQGAAFGAGAQDTMQGSAQKQQLKREVAFAPAARTGGCKPGDAGCVTQAEARSCGAFVQSKTRHGYGFGLGQEQATSRARAMCGGDACEVVAAGCEE
jgi:hypothetical protein